MATDHTAFLLRDGEFWLPPQFLYDDDTGIRPPVPSCCPPGGRLFPPVDYGNVCGHSALTSPGDSVVGSADVSDNEDDFISDLTRKVAQSTLDDDDFAPLHSKGLFPSGSPKSTLCAACGCRRVPGGGSPNGLPQLKPLQPSTLDVLYHAAGKVADMRPCPQPHQQVDQARSLQQRLHHLIRMHNMKAGVVHNPNQPSSHLSTLQLKYLLGGNGSKDAIADPGMSPSAWPTLQQAQQPRLVHGNANSHGGSAGMRAVFLGSGNGARRGSTGTGVFLPRRAVADPEPKRKPGCSTVLIPAKVVQALNLNLGEMNTMAPLTSSLNLRPESHFDGGSRRSGGGYNQLGHQEKQLRAANHHGQTAVHPEIFLPSEWTY